MAVRDDHISPHSSKHDLVVQPSLGCDSSQLRSPGPHATRRRARFPRIDHSLATQYAVQIRQPLMSSLIDSLGRCLYASISAPPSLLHSSETTVSRLTNSLQVARSLFEPASRSSRLGQVTVTIQIDLEYHRTEDQQTQWRMVFGQYHGAQHWIEATGRLIFVEPAALHSESQTTYLPPYEPTA